MSECGVNDFFLRVTADHKMNVVINIKTFFRRQGGKDYFSLKAAIDR
jgi:hypothetical protein